MSVIHDQQSKSVNQSGLSKLKVSCYLVCLAALLLSILPRRIACFGLFLLLLLAPLCAARWLWAGKPREKGSLFLAVCSAAGVLAGASGLSCLICFCLSILFWIAYLCQCAYGKMPLKELCHTGFFALFSNPSEYFTDVFQDWENRRMRLAAYAYTIYLLIALFIGLALSLVLASKYIPLIFQALCILVLKKIPLIATCLLLALFPTAFIYGFLKDLKTGAPPVNQSTQSQFVTQAIPKIPWGQLVLLVIAANWFLLIVELYYIVYLKDVPPDSYRFYDIFALLLLLYISAVFLYFLSRSQENLTLMKCVSLSISGIGLVILACWRLGVYIYYHGLWNDRIVFCLVLLLNIPFFLQALISCSTEDLIRCASRAFIILFAAALIIPQGLFLTQVNTQLFIHKYRTQQLAAQRTENWTVPIVLTDDDLHLDHIEGYGIEAVPALTWLVEIEDVTYQNQTVGQYARSSILNCLCKDLKLSRTQDDAADLISIYSVYSDIPRYRLPTRSALALEYLSRVKDAFK